ncbi:MAG TPA: DUF4845 domain-containing protein [Steroidobacteraceae bacterium]|nr:DUF4845 domain-containing protein [Steroidobacteraceae bacterium]
MKPRQRGATFLGILVIILILGCAGYAGLVLAPVYLDYMKVSRALTQVAADQNAINTNPMLIRKALQRHWDVEDISDIGLKEVEITKSADGYEMRANYTAERPFVANVYFAVKFDKKVTIH